MLAGFVGALISYAIVCNKSLGVRDNPRVSDADINCFDRSPSPTLLGCVGQSWMRYAHISRFASNLISPTDRMCNTSSWPSTGSRARQFIVCSYSFLVLPLDSIAISCHTTIHDLLPLPRTYIRSDDDHATVFPTWTACSARRRSYPSSSGKESSSLG